MNFRVNKFCQFSKIWGLLFFAKSEKIRFEVWNLAIFQTWNRIIFNIFKKSLEYSKIRKIYLFGNISEQILSKIRQVWSARFLQGISFIKNLPWELLVKWTRIKFRGNSLIFFFKKVRKKYKGFPCKKKYMGILYKINSDQI